MSVAECLLVALEDDPLVVARTKQVMEQVAKTVVASHVVLLVVE